MQEQSTQDYNKYMWRHSIVRMASAFALSITVIGGYHLLRATDETVNYLSYSPNIETTASEELVHNQIPMDIYHESLYGAESIALAGLSGYIALSQHKRNKRNS